MGRTLIWLASRSLSHFSGASSSPLSKHMALIASLEMTISAIAGWLRGADCRFDQGCVHVRDDLYGKHSPCWVGGIFGEPPFAHNPVRDKVLAEKLSSSATVEALSHSSELSATTRSPTENPSTFEPIAAATPTVSCPGTSEVTREVESSTLAVTCAPNSPSWICKSVPQTPRFHLYLQGRQFKFDFIPTKLEKYQQLVFPYGRQTLVNYAGIPRRGIFCLRSTSLITQHRVCPSQPA
jgi:hypothetical protein